MPKSGDKEFKEYCKTTKLINDIIKYKYNVKTALIWTFACNCFELNGSVKKLAKCCVIRLI